MKVLCVQSPRIELPKAEDYISKLREDISTSQFHLMVLPEKWVTNTLTTESEEWVSLLKIFQEISKEHSAVVVPGSFSFLREDGVYNSAPVLYKGKLKGFQDKISLYNIENGKYQRGREIKVFDTDGVKFSVPVCYDLDFPYFSKIAVDKGADFLVNPSLILSNFTEMWYIYVRGRSLENRLPVISVNSRTDPFSGGSIVTKMHPENGGVILETEILEKEHYKLVETNSTELREQVKSRRKEDFGQYIFNGPNDI